jgi:hypothetical protein
VQYIFIDERIRVLRGESARMALEHTNDARFYEPGYGIPKVTEERWQLAQRAEMAHWFGRNRVAADDGNFLQFDGFDSFDVLSGSRVLHAAELGCGPFTNLRLVGRVAHLASCTLIDPGIQRYVHHPNRYYDAQYLYVPPAVTWIPKLWRRAPHLLRALCRHLGWTVPVRSLVNAGGETFRIGEPCDLLVVINVLEHCRDARALIENVLSALGPRALVIIGDVFFNDEAVLDATSRCYDAAHPLRVTERVLNPVLDGADILYDRSEPHAVEGYPGTVKRCVIARVA